MRLANTDLITVASSVFERSMDLDPIDHTDRLDRFVFNFPDSAPVSAQRMEGDRFNMSNRATSQLLARVGMPQRVLDRLPVGLRFATVNHLVQHHEEGQMMMLRTVAGGDRRTVRALVTERYTPLDDVDIVPIVADILADTDAEVKLADFAEDHTHIRIVFPKTSTEVKKGDIVQTGISFRNSETGMGAFLVNPYNNRLICTNGMTSTESLGSTNIRHIGNPARMKDAVARAIADAQSGAHRMQEAFKKALDHAVTDPMKLINDHGLEHLTQDAVKAVLAAYTIEPDPNLFGVVNAFTRAAQTAETLEARYEFERVGARLLTAA